jgi:hypothetical protein
VCVDIGIKDIDHRKLPDGEHKLIRARLSGHLVGRRIDALRGPVKRNGLAYEGVRQAQVMAT